RIATETVGRARGAGIVPTELQLDFDAATRQLDDYASWVRSIRAAVAPLPVTVTALPAWLASRGVRAVVDAADGWVLQVHGRERPGDARAPFDVGDPAVARAAVETAAVLGRPFRVALPTYGYRLLFDRAERFVGFAAEAPTDAAPHEGSAREVRPDPTAIAA